MEVPKEFTDALSNYMSLRQAAAAVGMKPTGLRRYIHEGKLAGFIFNKSLFFYKSEVQRFIEERKELKDRRKEIKDRKVVVRTPYRSEFPVLDFLSALTEKNEYLLQEVRDLLVTLPGRCGAVLVLRYGLEGQPPQTLDQISKILGVTKERVRQIEAKGMRLMRHPSRARLLIPTKEQAHISAMKLCPKCESPKIMLHLKSISVDDLELSVRTWNGLKNLNIKNLAEVCSMRPYQFLKTKNVGRKSLRELEEVLGSLNLRLGMEVGPSTVNTAEPERG